MLKIVRSCISIIISVIFFILIPANARAQDSGITIDGYYDDWEDKPYTPVYYDTWFGNKFIHKVALFLDDQTLYGHIKMSNLSGKYYPVNSIYLFINNQYTISISINYKSSQNTGNINDLPVGRNMDLASIAFYDGSKPVGNAAVTVYDSQHLQGDDVEFSISLDSIRQYCSNTSIDEMQTFSLFCPYLGTQSVTITGTPTGPYICISVSILVSAACFVLIKKRRIGTGI